MRTFTTFMDFRIGITKIENYDWQMQQLKASAALRHMCELALFYFVIRLSKNCPMVPNSIPFFCADKIKLCTRPIKASPEFFEI